MRSFVNGFQSMLPITTGIIPFGAVMGTVCAEVKINLSQSVIMNIIVFAGASQLAALELMTKNAAILVVVLTGLIINMRFLLYSAAMSPIVQKSNTLVKFLCAYLLTDQTYAVMSAKHDKFKSHQEAISFYFGSALCMVICWHSAVVAGYIFGNFAPAEWALDFAVPLSFLSLVMPTLKNSKYVAVAIFSAITATLLNPLPYKASLIVTATLSILLAVLITKKRVET